MRQLCKSALKAAQPPADEDWVGPAHGCRGLLLRLGAPESSRGRTRLIVARCDVSYSGRLSAVLPEGAAADHGQEPRVGDGSRRPWRLQAEQLELDVVAP
jgi:hypothetical protein